LRRKPAAPVRESGEYDLVEVEGRDDEHVDRRARRGMGEQPRGRDPVHPRHADVHADDVAGAAVGERDDLDAVGGLSDDLDVGLGLEDRAQPAAPGGLVVGSSTRMAVMARAPLRSRSSWAREAPHGRAGRGRPGTGGREPATDERGALAHPGDAGAVADRDPCAERRRRGRR
jgi:hypothetical protein